MSEALAEDGSYSAVGFTYGSDYYDPSEPTEEEEPSRQRGERAAPGMAAVAEPAAPGSHGRHCGIGRTSLGSFLGSNKAQGWKMPCE